MEHDGSSATEALRVGVAVVAFTGSATSLDGQSATVTIHYHVIPPRNQFIPPNQTATVTPPVGSKALPLALSDVRQSHRSWRRGGTLARITSVGRTPIGTTFRFTLNEPARMRFAFTQPLPGHRVRGRCVAPTSENRRRRACTRVVTRGALSFTGRSGLNKVVFQGRLSGGKRLKPGRYAMLITATDATGQRASSRLRFTITA